MDAIRSERKQHALDMFGRLPAHYDELGALLSFGQDPRWRRAAVAAVRAAPEDRVLDVACGTGLVSRALIRRWGCRVVGLDQSAAMLEPGPRRSPPTPGSAAAWSWSRGRPSTFPSPTPSSTTSPSPTCCATSTTRRRRCASWPASSSPAGRVSSLEFCLPRGVWLPPWRLYTRVGLPLLGRLDSSGWYAAGRFLGPSIEGFYREWPLRRQAEAWRAAGIGDVRVRRMSLGGGVVIWGTVGA